MRVSHVVLTFNRADFVEQSMAHNTAHSGGVIDELIWVDNGSTDRVHDVMRAYAPDVAILNKVNLGVSKGWNRGFAAATGDYIVATDSDILMPPGWIATFRRYLTELPNTGVACVFPEDPRRTFKVTCEANGLRYHPCVPWGQRIFPRQLMLKKIGYLREDFGLYGHEDIEWARRALRVCRELGLLTYAIPGPLAEHLGAARHDPPEYRAFKNQEGGDARKRELLQRLSDDGFPYFNPYA